MLCVKCKAENLADNLYCTNCGENLAWQCLCGTTNSKNNKYCKICGRQFNANTLNTFMEFVSSAIHQYTKTEIAELIRKSILLTIDDDAHVDQNKVDKIFES